MARSTTYQRLSIGEKQAVDRERMREPSVSCPGCDTQTTASDLLAHVAQRCPGPREPGPGAKWVSWRDAVAVGVPKETIAFWARRGDVRTRGARGDRQYLLRDLALRVALRRSNRRR